MSAEYSSSELLAVLLARDLKDGERGSAGAAAAIPTAAIMLARQVENPHQPGLDALDITIRRNAYGRQIDSTIVESGTTLGGEPLEMVFIRAPRIQYAGDGVEVLAKRGDDAVLVRKGIVMAATFHPELSDDTRVHAEFLKLVKNGAAESHS